VLWPGIVEEVESTFALRANAPKHTPNESKGGVIYQKQCFFSFGFWIGFLSLPTGHHSGPFSKPGYW
jgi:hypothetical protein